ncbi:hypothetical protein MGG_13934 [Pyricularia oryzae 70-15]|uniref:Uncharacterized protein n=1 Tax=Pyricularia oryzae (strain 70-15 / ATCC MYA-4617 / FGSC 8958) TaxID=242507 RepID=G4N9T2_PYRO7|nr:uncharacterized protein MGG_13934 [Pyricularia oryzae 70-15]EHA49589.1 hypothetical protein MGG_13934 [Pyricularia oryzae 70-15]
MCSWTPEGRDVTANVDAHFYAHEVWAQLGECYLFIYLSLLSFYLFVYLTSHLVYKSTSNPVSPSILIALPVKHSHSLYFLNPNTLLDQKKALTTLYIQNPTEINRIIMSTETDAELGTALSECQIMERQAETAKRGSCRKLTLEDLPPEIMFIICEYVLFSNTQSAPRNPARDQHMRFQSPAARGVWLPRLLGIDGWEEQQTQTALLRTSRFLSGCARRVLATSKFRAQVDVDVMWVATSGMWPTVLSPTACYRSALDGSRPGTTVEVLTVSIRLFDDPAGLHWSLAGWGRFLPIPKGEVAIATAIQSLPPAMKQADRVVFCPPFVANGYYHRWGDFGNGESAWPKGWTVPDDLGPEEQRNRKRLLPWEGCKLRARTAMADKVANFLCSELLELMRRDEGLGELGEGLERVEFKVGGVLRRAVEVDV